MPIQMLLSMSSTLQIQTGMCCANARLNSSSSELMAMLEEEELDKVPILILANKQDIEGAWDEKRISKELQTDKIQDRSWAICGCSAVNGTGVMEALDWLVDVLRQNV